MGCRKNLNVGLWQTWHLLSIGSALRGLTGQDHSPTPATYCTLILCIARGHVIDCTISGEEEIALIYTVHSTAASAVFYTSLRLTLDGSDLGW